MIWLASRELIIFDSTVPGNFSSWYHFAGFSWACRGCKAGRYQQTNCYISMIVLFERSVACR